jgi:DNA (cytosine-5)-methyltransferase 1
VETAELIYGSVCSGIEAATVAWHPLGWQADFYSEIEPAPCAVLNHYYPTVPNHGDMTKFKEWPDATLDLLVGGTPCQSFSVAGLRKGLADPRGNLTLVYLAVADKYSPEWLVWENVPGVLSDGTGAFGAFLGGLAELGYGFAYRVLDAQYVRVESHSRAVPQRRRRVFVVGCARGWQRAAAVLFERDSLQGYPPPSRQAGKRVAPTIAARTRGGGGLGTDFDCDGGLITSDVSHCLNAGGMGRQDYETETLVAHSLRADGFDASEDGTGRGTPLVALPLGTRVDRGGSHREAEGNNLIPVVFDTTQITSASNYSNPMPGDPCHPLAAGAHPPAIATPMHVRRLTPRECDRLQGFRDDYTLVPFRGRMMADGPRYKMLGNSMAVPVMRWIGERIKAVEEIQ